MNLDGVKITHLCADTTAYADIGINMVSLATFA